MNNFDFTDNSNIGKEYNGFILLKIDDIPKEKCKAVFLRHKTTGLEVYHVLKDDKENLFGFNFRTPVKNSKGIPHILEHSTLCGSQKFPLKEPFNTLDNQSVKTYLNALTSPDKTLYPAASLVQSDFYNLFDVYADAVFFPNLTKETFQQEGHRLELDEKGKLSIQGVVYNEMKGDFSNFDSVVYSTVLKSMYPNSLYSFDSGGDPLEIPHLSYEEFTNYHKEYYTPSNCLLFLWGNIPTTTHLDFLNEKYICRLEEKFGKVDYDTVLLHSSKPIFTKKMQELYSVNHIKKSGTTKAVAPNNGETGATVGTVWYSKLTNIQKRFLSELLFGSDSSPMALKLKQSNLGDDLSSLCGNLTANIEESLFGFGLSGVKKSNEKKVYKLIKDSLHEIYNNGFKQEEINSALMGIDFSLHEVVRFHNPLSLSFMTLVAAAWTKGYDLNTNIHPIEDFEELKENVIKNPDYIKNIIKENFIDNKNSNNFCIVPSAKYFKQRKQKEKLLLQKLEKSTNKEELKIQLEKLHAYQQKVETEEELSCIPHLKLSELPTDLNLPVIKPTFIELPNPCEEKKSFELPVLISEEETNGVVYLNLMFPFDCLSPKEMLDMPLLRGVLGELGWSGKNWKDCTTEVCNIMGDFIPNFFTGTVGGNEKSLKIIETYKNKDITDRCWLRLSGRFLTDKTEESLSLLSQIITTMDFNDKEHFETLLKELKSYTKTNFIGNESSYLSVRGSSKLSVPCAIQELTHGITNYFYVDSYKEEDSENLLKKLQQMYQKILDQGAIIHITADSESLEKLLPKIKDFAINTKLKPIKPKIDYSVKDFEPLFYQAKVESKALENEEKSILEVFKTNTDSGNALVNLPCSENFTKETVAEDVLANWLNGHQLWEKIRMTGGAYGGGCSVNPIRKNFAMRSWRDPTPLKSIKVFEESLKELSEITLSQENVECSIISTYSDSIVVESPSARGDSALIFYLYGRTSDLIKEKIGYLLEITPQDVQNAAKRLYKNFKENHNELICVDKTEQFASNIPQILI